jgi:hypothetical protein
MSPKSPPLPDLDDEEFTARLKPLEAAVIPQSGPAVSRASTPPDIRSSVSLDDRPSGRTKHWNAGLPEFRGEAESLAVDRGIQKGSHPDSPELRVGEPPAFWNDGSLDIRMNRTPALRSSGITDVRSSGLVSAAERLAQIEQIRGPKRRFEYLIPARVGDALAEDAARQGKSATIRLLEVLRIAGYPVIEEDLIDLRKERRR